MCLRLAKLCEARCVDLGASCFCSYAIFHNQWVVRVFGVVFLCKWRFIAFTWPLFGRVVLASIAPARLVGGGEISRFLAPFL